MSECTHDCSSCSADCGERKEESLLAPANAQSHIKHVIGVVSGKGGVGKSMVTSLLAVTMRRREYRAAILDADVTGPSIPMMFGLHTRAMGTQEGILPVESKTGIPIISVNLLLEDEQAPVVWRGPIIAGTVKQFWSDVIWGDVDYMFVDMPPGTGDVPLTVFQSLPLDGIIIVTSPQELVSMIVSKAVNMAKMMNIPVLGIIENMSYYTCPHCHEKLYLFGESHVQTVADQQKIPVLGQLPIDPSLPANADNGVVELFEGPAEQEMNKVADQIEKAVKQMPNKNN